MADPVRICTATRMSTLPPASSQATVATCRRGGGGGATALGQHHAACCTHSGHAHLHDVARSGGGEPTSYGYAWTVIAVAAGTDAATYTVVTADIGKSASCIVTATNAVGSTAAPPSAGVTIADPGAATRSTRKA